MPRLLDLPALFVQGIVLGQALLENFTVADDYAQQIIEIVRDPSGELPNSLHLLCLAQLFLQKFPLRDVPKNGDDAFLPGDFDGFRRIERDALLTGLCTINDLQVAHAAMFPEHLDEPGSIFRAFPEFQLQGSAADHLLAPVPSDAKETLIHIDITALLDRSDGNRLGVRVERRTKYLLGLLPLCDIDQSFFPYRGCAILGFHKVRASQDPDRAPILSPEAVLVVGKVFFFLKPG